MIPRLLPSLQREELELILSRGSRDSPQKFEADFAATMNLSSAISFRYGRMALYAFFRAMGIESSTVVMQAYTCSVVAHAIVLSGNHPRFVDIDLSDYNQDLGQFADAIDETTRAVVVTHLFGCPADIDTVKSIVDAKAARYGHRIFIIQDLAHAFNPSWQGRPVAAAPDVALWGLGISKMITSVFGGVIGTNDPAIGSALSAERDRGVAHGNWRTAASRRAYLIAARAALSRGLYGAIRWADSNTPLLARFTTDYHLDGKIHFPPDAAVALTSFEAEVGRAQLRRLNEIIDRRRHLAAFFSRELAEENEIVLPPQRPGSTYSHFAVRVPDRDHYVRTGLKHGVHFGQVIDYVVPAFASYHRYAGGASFPNSELAASTVINLPIHVGVQPADAERIVEAVKKSATSRSSLQRSSRSLTPDDSRTNGGELSAAVAARSGQGRSEGR